MTNKNPGVLYVMQEQDFLTGVPSDNVKIGIVKSPRVPAQRLPEHQTGNSRRLIIAREYPSSAVSQAEALIHARLSTKRLIQEWFISEDEDKSKAFQGEIELALREAAELADLKDEVEKLKRRETKGKTRKARDWELEAMVELADYLCSIRALEIQQAATKKELADASKNAFGIEMVAHWTFTPPSRTFKEDRLKDLDPKTHSSLLREQVSGSLKLDLPPLSAPTKLEFPEELENLCSEAVLLARTEHHEQLHYKYLQDEAAISHLKTLAEAIRLRLAISMGGYERVTDVGSWVRKPKEGLVSGYRDQLKANEPKLYEACLSLGNPSRGFEVTKFRSYPHLER